MSTASIPFVDFHYQWLQLDLERGICQMREFGAELSDVPIPSKPVEEVRFQWLQYDPEHGILVRDFGLDVPAPCEPIGEFQSLKYELPMSLQSFDLETNCIPFDWDATVPPALPIRQKRTGTMSKRFQKGHVYSVGKMWHGRYRGPGTDERKLEFVDLGERKLMTKLEARRKLADIIEKSGVNTTLEISTVPADIFNDAADNWISKRLPQLGIGTQHDAPGQIAKHLRSYFGAMALDSIKTGTVNVWIAGLTKSGLHPKTVHNNWKMFRAIMNWNSQQNDMPERAFYPTLPDIPQARPRRYTFDEMAQIIEVSAHYPARSIRLRGQYKPLFRLTASSGLRSGEISGLHVEDLNFSRGLVHVVRSVRHGVECPTKGKRIRDVYIDSITVQMLKEFLENRTTGRVFQSRDGSPVRNQQLVEVLHWATKRLGIPTGAMHAFRHGRITHLRKSGVLSKIVQEQVGHQNAEMTDHYTDVEEAFVRESVERLKLPCSQLQNLFTN